MMVSMASAIVVRVCAKKSDVLPFSTRRLVCFMKMGNTKHRRVRLASEQSDRTYDVE